jgi:hypothetical protein
MALDAQVRAILKRIYKDGVESLLFRNSPVLSKIKKEVYDGAELAFPAIYARSPACSSWYPTAKKQAAADSTKAIQWIVPLDQRQMFSVFNISQKEILASKTRKGSFIPAIKLKSFGAMEALRKQLAVALYGDGSGKFGEVGKAGTFTTPLSVGTNTITLADHALMGIDVGSHFQLANATTGIAGAGASVNTVVSIDGNTVTFTATAADTVATGQPLVYEGSSAGSNTLAPYGLSSWAPATNRGSTFCGVDRSPAPDRLSGHFLDDSALAKASNRKVDSIRKAIKIARRFGSPVSEFMVAVNDNDYEAITKELDDKMRLFQDDNGASGSGTRRASGQKEISWAFATTLLDIVIDDPYVAEGEYWMFRPEDVSFVTYSNTAPIGNLSEGAEGNAEGRADPLGGPDIGEQPMQINLDDLFTIAPAQEGGDGEAVAVSANVFGSFVVWNQANIVRGRFPAA